MNPAAQSIIDFITSAALVAGGGVAAVGLILCVYCSRRGETRAGLQNLVLGVVGGALLAGVPFVVSNFVSGTWGSTAAEQQAPPPPPAAATDGSFPWPLLLTIIGVIAAVAAAAAAVKAAKATRKKKHARKAATAHRAADLAQERDHWERAIRRHDSLRSAYLAVENDPMAHLTMPLLWSAERSLSAAWWDAQEVADNRRTEKMPADPTWRHDYADAVARAELAFNAACSSARRAGLTTMSQEERRRVERAQKALRTVLDDASTEAERRIAYRVVLSSIEGIVDLPPVVRDQLTARTGRELTPASDAKDWT